MPSVEAVKNILNRALNEIIDKMKDLEDMMLYINSLYDIVRNKFLVNAVIEIKKILSTFGLGDYIYREPSALNPPNNNERELYALFSFYKRMHISFWEIRAKLKIMLNYLLSLQALEKAISLVKIVKAIKDQIVPAHEQVLRLMKTLPFPEEISKAQSLQQRQETILSKLQQLQDRVQFLAAYIWNKSQIE